MPNDERFKIFIASYLVLIRDNKILLSKRKDTGYQDGNYSLVAGHLDGEETAAQSIAREAKEEANIELTPEDLKVSHVMHRYNTNREYIDIYLKAKNYKNEIKNLEPHKCEELSWHPLDNLPDNLIPEVKAALKSIQKKSFYGEIGW